MYVVLINFFNYFMSITLGTCYRVSCIILCGALLVLSCIVYVGLITYTNYFMCITVGTCYRVCRFIQY